MFHATALPLAALRRAAAAAVLGLAVVAAPALAQVSPEDEARQRMLQEFQEIQMQLEQIEQQALQDPELQQQRMQLQELVVEAIHREDPEAEQKMERMEELQDELHEAQEAGEQAEVQALVNELTQIQGSLEEARIRVMQDSQVQREAEEFRQALVAEMREIDPQTDQLLERLEELQMELQGIG